MTTLSVTEITGTFTDPTTGQPISNINVSFQVNQVLYIGGIPAVAPGSPIAAEVAGGQLLAASGAPVTLADLGNAVTLMSGTGFWYWTVTITGDITDSWSFFLSHSASPVDLYSTRNSAAVGGGAVTSVFGRTGAVVAVSGDYTASQTGALAAKSGSVTVPAADLSPQVTVLGDASSVAVNAALGNDFRLTFTSGVGSSRTIAAPSNPADGEKITFELIQAASGGPYTVTWASGAGGYDFGTTGAPTLSNGASAIDQVAFRYSATKGEWLCLGSATGF